MPIDRKSLPSTHRKFVQQFSDDQACAAFLEQLRWPDGFCCPVCQTTGEPWRQSRGRLVCSACECVILRMPLVLILKHLYVMP